MKYIYLVLAMLSFSIFIYPDVFENEDVQYYDMSEYEITITPKK